MAPENWKPRKLTDLGFVGRGKSKHRPRNESSLYGGKYPFVQTGDIKGAELYLRDYTQTYNDKGLAQSKLWKPGTLCITIAANIAETAILGMEACFPDSVVGFVADEDKSDVRFIKYYVDTIKLRMQSISRGTTQDNLSLEKLHTFDILTPPLHVQHKIADVLSAYDDLIEVNARRIRILEQMAQSVYREWFGKVDGKSLPEGWEVKTFSEVCNEIIDGDWIETKDQDGKDYRLLQVSNIGLGDFVETGNFRYVSQETFERLKCQEVVPGDILVSRMPTPIGRGWLVTEMPWRMITAVDVAIVRTNPDLLNPFYCVYWLNSPETLARSEMNSSGTTRPRITRRVLANFDLVIPPIELQDKLGKIVGDVYEMQTVLRRKNANLRRTRDLLLPRLVSGEIAVHE